MLLHPCVKRHIIVLHPAAKGVEEEHWVLVTKLEQLLSCIFEHNNMTVVKGVPKLESIDGICTSGYDLIVDLPRCLSVGVKTIIELNVLHKAHI